MSKKCKATKKTSFSDEKKANRAMFRIWSHDSSADIYDLHVYPCPDSNPPHWHVGHKSYFQKTQERIHEAISKSSPI